MFLEQFLRTLSAIVIGIWVARYLGPDEFGLFSYVLAFTGMFRGVVKLGLDGILVRSLVNQPKSHEWFLGTAFWLKVIGATLIIVFIGILLSQTNHDQTTKLYILIVSFGFLFQSFEVVQFYFESKVLARIVIVCKIFQIVISSLIKIILVMYEASLIWFVAVTLIDAVVLAITFMISYFSNKKGFVFYRYFDFNIAKKLLIDSWPLIIASMSVYIFNHIDKVMINHMLGAYETGIFTAGVKFSEAAGAIPLIIASSLFPAILSSKNISSELYYSRLQKFYAFMTWFALLIVFVMFVFADKLISLYGEEYDESSSILRIYCFSLIFIFQWVARGRWVLAENLQYLTYKFMVLGALGNIILNNFLISEYGIYGAAYATLVTQLLITLIIPLYDKRTRYATLMLYKSFYTWRTLK